MLISLQKHFKIICTTLFIVGLFLVAQQSTFAQDVGPCEKDPDSTACACVTRPDSPQCKDDDGTSIADVARTAATIAFPASALLPSGEQLKTFVHSFLSVSILPLFASFLYLSSLLFEISIWLGIVQFSTLLGGDSPWINSIWSTVRDILNIGVIFVLLYTAIKVIIGQGGEIKKIIAGVVLFGVMTNFSLFLTKAAIDVANVVALEFYNQMRVKSDVNELSLFQGLGATIAHTTGLVKLYAPPDPKTGEDAGLSSEVKGSEPLKNSLLFLFGTIAVFVAVSFIYLQAAFLFLWRTIALIFIMIFSPLMFAGGVFTPLEKWVAYWHKEFVGQVTVAPIFLILLYVALTILGSLVGGLNEQFIRFEDQGEIFILPLILVLLSTALVIFAFATALHVAKKMSGSIGSSAAGLGAKFAGIALNASASGGAMTMRRAFKATGLGDWATRNPNKFGAQAVSRMANSTFDIRNSKIARATGGGVSAALKASSGGAVNLSDIKVGKSTTIAMDSKGPITRTKEFLDGKLETREKKYNERAVAGLKAQLKKVENDADVRTDHTVLDREVKYRDTDGKLQTKRRGEEGEEDWKKEIEKINKMNKGYIAKEKDKYIAGGLTSAQASAGGRIFGVAARAAYRAHQAELKKKKDSPQYKLDQYRELLKEDKYSSITGLTKEQVSDLKNEDIISYWELIRERDEAKLKDMKAELRAKEKGMSAEDIAKSRIAIRDQQKDVDKAKNASKKMSELEKQIKAISDAEKGKKADEPKDKK